MNENEKAYIAGLFDGEGCISIRENKGKKGYVNPVYVLDCIISMTDFPVVNWVHETTGLGAVYIRPGYGNHKPQLRWAASSNQAAKFIEDILPYLRTKRAQADIALEFQHLVTKRSGKGGGIDECIVTARREYCEKLKSIK